MPKKLDDMVKAISRANPDWSEDRVWATAQSQFKRSKQLKGGMPGSTLRRTKKGGK